MDKREALKQFLLEQSARALRKVAIASAGCDKDEVIAAEEDGKTAVVELIMEKYDAGEYTPPAELASSDEPEEKPKKKRGRKPKKREPEPEPEPEPLPDVDDDDLGLPEDFDLDDDATLDIDAEPTPTVDVSKEIEALRKDIESMSRTLAILKFQVHYIALLAEFANLAIFKRLKLDDFKKLVTSAKAKAKKLSQ